MTRNRRLRLIDALLYSTAATAAAAAGSVRLIFPPSLLSYVVVVVVAGEANDSPRPAQFKVARFSRFWIAL
jgi:hypothetical protein